MVCWQKMTCNLSVRHSFTDHGFGLPCAFQDLKVFLYIRNSNQNRGALNNRAEIKPFEPDPGNAGEGRDAKHMTAFYSYLPFIV